MTANELINSANEYASTAARTLTFACPARPDEYLGTVESLRWSYVFPLFAADDRRAFLSLRCLWLVLQQVDALADQPDARPSNFASAVECGERYQTLRAAFVSSIEGRLTVAQTEALNHLLPESK